MAGGNPYNAPTQTMTFWTNPKHLSNPNDTTPGVKVLKQLWDINKQPKTREIAKPTSSDIYHVSKDKAKPSRRNPPKF
jgi:hypothetical protein